MNRLKQHCERWLETARRKLEAGGLGGADLDALGRILDDAPPGCRQRLLYLHANGPSLHAKIIGMALHEPVKGGRELAGQRDEWPYDTVHDAILDGWQIVHFPQQLAPFDDREVDMIGFEFIGQKWSSDDGDD
ncbi:MAG: hypothetical protein CMJ18_07205 [Phycisphaeraceae bacterium]|nr:hypothetical protein [Phycisphaeraceae bacterium]